GEGDVYLEISAQAQAPPTPPQGGGIGKDPFGTDSKEKNSKDKTLNPSQEGGIGKDPFGTDSKEKNSKDKTLNPSQGGGVGGAAQLIHFNNRFELDGMQFDEPVPNLFSCNNPFGACPTCEGFSQVLGIDPDLVIPDKRLSVYDGAVAPWKGGKMDWWRQNFIKGAKKFNFPIHKPIADLTDKQIRERWEGSHGVYGINDFFKDVESQLYKVQYRVMLSRYRGRDRKSVV